MTDSGVKTASISVGAVGGRGKDEKVLVDGHDIANSARGFRLAAKVGDLTELELDLQIDERTSFDGSARVTLPPATRDALIALDWTPPPGEPDSVRFWVYTNDEMLAEMRSDVVTLPPGWTILRALEIPDMSKTWKMFLVEIADANGPTAASGKVINPTFSRDSATGVVTVIDYGLSVEPVAADPNEITVHTHLSLDADIDLQDDILYEILRDAGLRVAETRNRRLVGKPVYAGASIVDGKVVHAWRFKTAPAATLATGGLVRQSDQLTMVSEAGAEATS